MRFIRRSLVGIFLLAATLTLLAWAGNTVRVAVQDRMSQEPRSFPQRERVFAVNVVTLSPQTLTPEMTVFGELRSVRTLDLRAPIGGTILAADPALTEGGVVTKGQQLVQIDPTDAEAVRDRAQADLLDAQAEQRDAVRNIALSQDELAAATAQADLREAALTRARDLATRGVGTTAAIETAELAASAASAAVLARRQAVAQAEARRDQAATRIARAEIDLSEAVRDVAATRIVAEFDGVLSDVTVSPGGRLGANERFAQLIDPTALEVMFRVSTAQYARLLNEGSQLRKTPVRAVLDVSGVNLVATGQIIRESASVGAGQTGRTLYATLRDAAGFRPGDFVMLRVSEPPLADVARVPATAVAAGNTVLVVGDENRLELRDVEVLRKQEDDVIVAVGALAGAMIVAARTPLLGAGIKVDPITPGGAQTEQVAAVAETIVLDPDRRAKLVAFVEGSRMPDAAKTRILAQLAEDVVPTETVTRIESRMGG